MSVCTASQRKGFTQRIHQIHFQVGGFRMGMSLSQWRELGLPLPADHGAPGTQYLQYPERRLRGEVLHIYFRIRFV